MIPILFWIFGCYALAAAAVHAYTALAMKRCSVTKHYVLIAGNEGLHMEMYMRCLRRFSQVTGTLVRVTVLNQGCEDETMGIVRCFARRGMDVRVRSCDAFSSSRRQFDDFARELGHRPGQGWSEGASPRVMAGMEVGGKYDDRAAKDKVDCTKREVVKGSSLWAKWQRFRNARKLPPRKAKNDSRQRAESIHLMWMLQEEGIVTEYDHAILVNLRNPADICKLPL
ncbi:hypothetical protein PAECIP111893_00374 [Paenibacillus plantiphilus]|uniref:Uncharacterized protein n=1 Tax=Paenibacillus plantiphilus TaxID=2905650 RepID=A0ABN8FZ41_9BACL|nr:hypothetical protein [Paenibacillus plantiphilus]CAH1193044.1 hypothetical protein PAECIP111893_00374 [Paenibacillus plantiphilus]